MTELLKLVVLWWLIWAVYFVVIVLGLSRGPYFKGNTIDEKLEALHSKPVKILILGVLVIPPFLLYWAYR